MTPEATLRVDADDGVVVARVSGEVDLANARDLGAQIAGAIPNSALGLVLDLTATGYIDSSGVQVIFELAERLTRRQQRMRVVVPQGAPIRRVLRVVDLQSTVPLLADVGAAAEEIRSSA